MAYEVIARKWRPQKFEDLVGQEHVGTTLKNAIMQDRIANAYLFVGTRGIGKTTSARIFAKALNCEQTLQGEPCCQCDSCLSITQGNNLDVMEIDAASRNSVSDMRELANEVVFMPAKAKYKIYIIDEVHMLSAQAWNALLKTIEEPPAHAKFIFATTEAHKVLGTILSRCQRFDLRRIPTNLIADKLIEITKAENVRITQSAINVIARAANGGMRDAQSLLDQMISFFNLEDEITEKQILSVFGLSSNVEIKNLVSNILGNKRSEVIFNIYNLAKNGKNLEILFDELLQFLRGVQISILIKTPSNILECGDEMIAFYQDIAKSTDNKTIQLLLEVLAPVGYTLHNAVNKQVFLENLIFKAMRIAHAVQIDDILKRLNEVRKTGELTPLENLSALKEGAKRTPHTEIQSPHTEKEKTPIESSSLQEEALEQKEPIHDDGVELIDDINKVENLDLPKPPQKDISKTAEIPKSAPQEEEKKQKMNSSQEQSQQSQEPLMGKVSDVGHTYDATVIKSTEQQPTVKVSHFQVDKEQPEKIWHSIIEDMKNVTNTEIIIDIMKEGIPKSIENGILNIVYNEEYGSISMLKTKLSILNNSFKRISQDGIEVNIVLEKGIASHHHKPARNALISEGRKNKFVQDVLELFDGEIIEAHG